MPIDVPYGAVESASQQAYANPLFQKADYLPADWWNLFKDPQLTAFIEQAFLNNPTLQETKARILLASANAARVKATLFPNIFWAGDMSRQKLSETGVIPFAQNQVPVTPKEGVPEYFTLYETSINLTYEFDFWGKNRNTLQAAIGEMQASIADSAFAQLQLGIELARVYFGLQIDYKREKIAIELQDTLQEALELTRKRVENHLDNALVLNTAAANFYGARENLTQIRGDIAIKENQLRTLLAGNFEEDIEPIRIDEMPLPSIPLPEALPLHLIAHRPDIRAQLWLIESAGKMIDVARAGFYPDFNLRAFFGFQTIHFQELFRWPSTYFNVGPAFTLPLFDGGRLLANLRGSEFNYDIAIFKYNELVLRATNEVLDGIALMQIADEQQQQYNQQLSLMDENLQLTGLRVQYNIDSQLDYLISEENMLWAYEDELVARSNTYQAFLSLIKALGGGYDPCECR